MSQSSTSDPLEPVPSAELTQLSIGSGVTEARTEVDVTIPRGRVLQIAVILVWQGIRHPRTKHIDFSAWED